MKRHTDKNKKILGVILIVAMVAIGVGMGVHNTHAEKTAENDVKLTFNFDDSLTVDFPSGSGWTGGNHETALELEPGSAKEGDVAGPVTIGSNSEKGFRVSATVGTKGGDGNLNFSEGTDPSNKITLLGESANVADMSAQSGSVWGIRYAVDSVDINTQKYNGFKLDNSDEGATGTEIINATGVVKKTFKYQVGVKTDKTLKAGLYQGTIHFYITANS